MNLKDFSFAGRKQCRIPVPADVEAKKNAPDLEAFLLLEK